MRSSEQVLRQNKLFDQIYLYVTRKEWPWLRVPNELTALELRRRSREVLHNYNAEELLRKKSKVTIARKKGQLTMQRYLKTIVDYDAERMLADTFVDKLLEGFIKFPKIAEVKKEEALDELQALELEDKAEAQEHLI
ncbi:hypothetical protein SAICODRAFT_32135, partial [Saitoella complicata NRRL Y-17804]